MALVTPRSKVVPELTLLPIQRPRAGSYTRNFTNVPLLQATTPSTLRKSFNTAATGEVKNNGGVIAWQQGMTTQARVYDPTRSSWRATNVANTTSVNDLRNVDGVVAWSSGTLVKFLVYDPARGRWMLIGSHDHQVHMFGRADCRD